MKNTYILEKSINTYYIFSKKKKKRKWVYYFQLKTTAIYFTKFGNLAITLQFISKIYIFNTLVP